MHMYLCAVDIMYLGFVSDFFLASLVSPSLVNERANQMASWLAVRRPLS